MQPLAEPLLQGVAVQGEPAGSAQGCCEPCVVVKGGQGGGSAGAGNEKRAVC